MRPRSCLAVIGLLIPLTSPLALADDPCPPPTYCEFPRWETPDALTWGAYGVEIVVADDLAVIGASGERNVHVYRLVYGAWELVDTLAPPEGSSAGYFGRSIAVTQDHIAVGARHDDTSGEFAGAVFLYERTSSDSWDHVETLLAPVPAPSSYFGTALAAEGDLLVVSQPEAPDGGSVHLYELGDVTALVDTVQIPGSTGLGGSLALADGFLVLGDQWDGEVAFAAGAVYTTTIDAVTGFGEGAKTTAGDGQVADRFGQTVATDGATVVVGAVGADGLLVGAAYVYEVTEELNPLDFTQRLTSCAPVDNGWFGSALDVQGDRIVVGSSGADSVEAFRRSSGWKREAEFRAADGGDQSFGFAVDLDGDYLLVGASQADGELSWTGAVYEFSLANPDLAGAPCPCETRPVGIEYGTGKAGTLGVPELQMTEPPVLGAETIVSLRNARPGAPVYLLLGFATAALPFDQGMIYVADPLLIPMPVSADATGALDLPYTLSVTPANCGLLLAHQMLVLDPAAAGPVGTAQTNGLLLVPGS